jgi:hypothetical protein
MPGAHKPLKTPFHGEFIIPVNQFGIQAAQIYFLSFKRLPGKILAVGKFPQLAAQLMADTPPPVLFQENYLIASSAAVAIQFTAPARTETLTHFLYTPFAGRKLARGLRIDFITVYS